MGTAATLPYGGPAAVNSCIVRPARCTLTHMPRRFQFSLGRLIGSVTLLCVAIGFWRQSFAYGDHSSFGSLNPFALTGFAMTLAASVGLLFNRALVFAFSAYLVVLGLAVAFLSWFIMWLWFW